MPVTVLGNFAKTVTAPSASAVQLQGSALGGVQSLASSGLTPVPLARLGDTDLVNTPIVANFTQDVADAYGDLVTNDDGWDVNFALLTMDFDADVNGVESMLLDLADADFIDDAFTSDTMTPIVASTQDFLATGDAMLAQYNTIITPVDTSGGGGGGGTGGGTGGGGGGGGGGTGGGGGGGGDEQCLLVSDANGYLQYICGQIEIGGGSSGKREDF